MCEPVADNARYRGCTECETDSYGWKYSYPGWGAPTFERDYGEFLKTLVSRYRRHPALIGWVLGLGPSSEDMYGPSYIVMRMVYADLIGSAKADQVADYSDQAQRRFREWARTKYRSDDQLRKAWGDPGLSLQSVRLPDPRTLFVPGKSGPFPDDFFLHFFVELDALSPQGRDLYDFREHVRNQSRSRFTKLFKELDPQHVLIYLGTNNDGIFGDPAIDGILGNNHVEYALNQLEESNLIAVDTALNAKHGKASLYGIESVGDDSGLLRGTRGQDRSGQLWALRHAAQTVLCSGGYFGYASEIAGAGGFQPSWNSEDRRLLPEIAAFVPTKDCICYLVPSNQTVMLRHTVGQLVEALGLRAQYRCSAGTGAAVPRPQQPEQRPAPPQSGQAPQPPPQGQPSKAPTPFGMEAGRPYCGDGICDDFEKSKPGVCPADCR
jgi:hypothetical protein